MKFRVCVIIMGMGVLGMIVCSDTNQFVVTKPKKITESTNTLKTNWADCVAYITLDLLPRVTERIARCQYRLGTLLRKVVENNGDNCFAGASKQAIHDSVQKLDTWCTAEFAEIEKRIAALETEVDRLISATKKDKQNIDNIPNK